MQNFMSRTCILNKSTPGFTLVEVIMSVAIAGIILTAAFSILWQTMDMSKRVDSEYTALNLAQSRLEEAKKTLETRGFGSLDDLDETEDMGNFKRETTVGEPIGRLKQVTVKISYKHLGVWKDDALTLTTNFVNME